MSYHNQYRSSMATDIPQQNRNWQELAADKRRECRQQIPREWTLGDDLLPLPLRLLEFDLPRRSGIMSELELDLTESYTAVQLLVKLASGQISSLAVTTAFCKRAAIAQQAVGTGAGICIYLGMIGLYNLTLRVDVLPHGNILPAGP
jgi:hypothetical protein